MTCKEIELVILKLTTKKSLHPRGFTGELYKTYRRIYISSSQSLPKNRREGNASKLMLGGHYYPDNENQTKTLQERKLQTNITNEYRSKKPQ